MIARIEQAAGRSVSRETSARLNHFVALLEAESARHSLISKASIADIWERHVVDSAQLVRFEPRSGASWVDIGSGAGLPGIVVACLVDGPVTLVEPRRLRAEFLHKAIRLLDLPVEVVCTKAERVMGTFDVITARAVAPLERLLKISHHLSTTNSCWLLPKGRNAESELAEAKRAWQGAFHVEHSLTDPDSRIVVGTGVEARGR